MSYDVKPAPMPYDWKEVECLASHCIHHAGDRPVCTLRLLKLDEFGICSFFQRRIESRYPQPDAAKEG
jgi:hypothetical protein